MQRKDSKDEECSGKLSAIIEANGDDRNQESEQSGTDDDRVNTNPHSTVRQSNHEEPARRENVSDQQHDDDENQDDEDDAPLSLDYMKRRRWQARRNPGEKQSSHDKHHHHHHPKSPHAQSTSLPSGRPRRNRRGHMPQTAAYKASPPSTTDKTTAGFRCSAQQSTRESNIKKVPYKVAQDPLGDQFQPQEDPSKKASNNEPYEEVPVATAETNAAAAAAAASTSQEEQEVLDGFWDTLAASTTGLERQNRLEDQHEMRLPLTAEQRLRTPIRLPTGASTAAMQQRPPERLVEATPVYRQQRRSPQQVRLHLQNLPRALTEEEYQEQVRRRQEQVQRRQCKKAIYGFSVLGLLLLVVVVMAIMVLVNVNKDKTPTNCFSTAQELQDVADHFRQLQVDGNHTLIQTEITQVYGRVEKWCVGDIQDFSGLFSGFRNAQMLTFNSDITQWDMSSATDVSLMFSGATSFNQPLDSWDMSGVTDMYGMFSGAASFNQPLDSWNVSGVTSMSDMFSDASSFNQPLNSWNVSYVKYMSWMFHDASSFNQPLASWNVSNVTDMSEMFSGAASFNQPLDSWDVSGVKSLYYGDLDRMFSGALSFNQNLCTWGQRLPKDYWPPFNMLNMFVNTSCPMTDDPDFLGANPPGPFCHRCA